ncbi:hypothetical protein AWENTII_002610 [Aspergillus wentii]
MRPVPDVVSHRSRKSSFEQQWTDPRNTAPATFFLTRSSHDNDPEDELSQDDSEISKDSTYGVQSLGEATYPATLGASKCQPDPPFRQQTLPQQSPTPPRGLPRRRW